MSAQLIPEDQAPSQAAELVSGSRWRRIAAALLTEPWLIRLAALLMFGLYLRTIGFAPVYDDNLIGAGGVSSLWDVPKFFAHDIFGLDGTAHSVYYRPLAQTYGFVLSLCTGGAPGWLHLSSIFLHLTAVYLAYVFGRYLFHDARLAGLTALLFGLHPTMVESTTWIGSSTVDGLGGVFFFATLCALMKWQESESAGWLWGSVVLYSCAVFTKETMVVIPALIAFYLFVSMRGEGRIFRTLRALVPFGVVSIVYLAIRHQVIKPASTTAEYVHPVYTFDSWWTAPYATWWYIRHLVMPWGLSVEYLANVLTRPTLKGFVLLGLGLLLVAAITLWIWSRQRSKMAGFLIFWFAVTLAMPVILAPMVSEHDRYVYIPSYAFCALVAWMVLYLEKVNAKVGLVAAIAIVALWSGITWHEMGYWDCDTTLWTRVLEVSPAEPKARLQLASIYNGEMKNVPKALDILNEGLRYRPNSPKLWTVLADIHSGNKQFDEARTDYLKIMQLTDPQTGLGVEAGLMAGLRANAANKLADLDVSANNFAEAEQYARTALSLNPGGVGYHLTLSRALAGEGRTPEARAENALELQLRLAQVK